MTTDTTTLERYILTDQNRVSFATENGLTQILFRAKQFATKRDALSWLASVAPYDNKLFARKATFTVDIS